MDSDNRVSRMLPQPTPRHALRIKRRLLRTPNGLSFMESPVAKPPCVRTVSRWRPDGISTTRSVSDKGNCFSTGWSCHSRVALRKGVKTCFALTASTMPILVLVGRPEDHLTSSPHSGTTTRVTSILGRHRCEPVLPCLPPGRKIAPIHPLAPTCVSKQPRSAGRILPWFASPILGTFYDCSLTSSSALMLLR